MTFYTHCSYVSIDGVIYPSVEAIQDNQDDEEFCAIIAAIQVGETRTVGGGAGPLVIITGVVAA